MIQLSLALSMWDKYDVFSNLLRMINLIIFDKIESSLNNQKYPKKLVHFFLRNNFFKKL